MRTTKELSITALERLLDRRKSRLNSLVQKRNGLRKNVHKLEGRIALLSGSSGGTMRSAARRLRKRPKNSKPLHQVVTELLSKNNTGYPLANLSEKVLDTGYKSGSSNFKNVLYQALYNAPKIMHDGKTGNYRLKGGAG